MNGTHRSPGTPEMAPFSYQISVHPSLEPDDWPALQLSRLYKDQVEALHLIRRDQVAYAIRF